MADNSVMFINLSQLKGIGPKTGIGPKIESSPPTETSISC